MVITIYCDNMMTNSIFQQNPEKHLQATKQFMLWFNKHFGHRMVPFIDTYHDAGEVTEDMPTQVIISTVSFTI